MSQFIVSELSQQGDTLGVTLAIYLDDAFDYPKAKATADGAKSALENAQDASAANVEQIRLLQKQVEDLRAQCQVNADALKLAEQALNPDAVVRIGIAASEFQSILDDPKLPTAAAKIQAAINLKRAEIGAQVKAQAERLKLMKEAQGTVVGVPVTVTAKALTLGVADA